MADTAALYRTVVRLAGMDDATVTLVIPASDFPQVVFAKDNMHIPRWLLDKPIGYRFVAKVNINAERPEHIMLWDCENDPRTPAEQIAHVNEVLGIETAPASACTIVTEFLGIKLDPCGDPAAHVFAGGCERGHTRTRPICSMHAKAFNAVPAYVVCEQCSQEGHDTQMVVRVVEGKP